MVNRTKVLHPHIKLGVKERRILRYLEFHVTGAGQTFDRRDKGLILPVCVS